MTSRERMLAALSHEQVDYVPCSFMIFANMRARSATNLDFVEKQLALGLDAYVHAGHLNHALHTDARYREWTEEDDGVTYFCRRIDTPKGPLTGRVRQRDGWPGRGRFPLFDDLIVTRAREILVKPEQDLEKLAFVFGPFTDENINRLRESAREAARAAEKHRLLQVGGWMSYGDKAWDTNGGVMGCDAMAWLSGFEQIMVLSMTKPDLVREYANIIHEWNLRQIEIYLDVTDADILWRRGWYETTEFWTPDAYRNIIAPTIRREADLVHQAGKKYGYIITAAFMPILDDILDTGVDALIGVDPKEGKGTDLRAVKETFLSRRKTVWGGVSGAVTVELGTEQETEEAVVEALRTLGEGGGLILSPVDNVREDTDNAWRNTQVFIDTWKKHRAETP